MPIDQLCDSQGINTGTADCAPIPGVAQYLNVWGGMLSASQLAQGRDVCEASLIADSKKSKSDSSKLMMFPLSHDTVPTKEANSEITLADGFKQVKREGVPSYTMKLVNIDMYLGAQLRKINNKRIRYSFTDDKNQFLASYDADANMIGRWGQIFVDGVDIADTGTTKAYGEVTVTIQAETAAETFDFPCCIQLSKPAPQLFKRLLDIQLYQPTAATHAGGTAATASVTITNVGADNDTIDVLYGGVSLTDEPVEKTSSESTVTLLAVKIKDAINAATSTNGGYTATNSSGVITVTAPVSLGASLNTLTLTVTIDGTIAASNTAFTGGVNTNTTLHVSGKVSPSPNATTVLDFYSGSNGYGSSALGTTKTLWSITDATTGTAKTIATLAPNASGYFDITVNALPLGTYIVKTVTPDLLDAANVKGIECIQFTYTKA